jgi:hypothetical protein
MKLGYIIYDYETFWSFRSDERSVRKLENDDF